MVDSSDDMMTSLRAACLRLAVPAVPAVLLAALAAAFPTLQNVAYAQASPSVAVNLNPPGSVTEGAPIAVTMSFGNLAFDSDRSTTDYVFRADVVDADECEGHRIGVERYMYQVDEDPESRAGTISAGCPPGDYTVEASISLPGGSELASGRARFTVSAPTPEPTPSLTASIALSPSGEVAEGAEIAVTLTFAGLTFDSDRSTIDYTFRADVVGADECEGNRVGVTRYIYQVDENPEVREGAISASCPPGDYAVRASISSPDNVKLASASAAFSVAAPESAPRTRSRGRAAGQ